MESLKNAFSGGGSIDASVSSLGTSLRPGSLDHYTTVTTTGTGTSIDWNIQGEPEEKERGVMGIKQFGTNLVYGNEININLNKHGLGVFLYSSNFAKAVDENGTRYYIKDNGDHWLLHAELKSHEETKARMEDRWGIRIDKSPSELADNAAKKLKA